MKSILLRVLALLVSFTGGLCRADALFGKPNLVAWCIVPFDSEKRSPEARAAMVARMGLTKIAYDWREEHVGEFEREILAYQKNGIELFAFWSTHDAAFDLFRKYGLHPQIWIIPPQGEGATAEAQVRDAAAKLLPVVERTRAAGCPLGLYNHGGWSGEPENMTALCLYLRNHHAANHVGLVYNFHHGHAHLHRLPQALAAMKPYLLCVNLNGMDPDGEAKGRKILPLGTGAADVTVLRTLRASGYGGPVGLLNHTKEDAEGRLLDNWDGLNWLLPQLDDAPPGPRPAYRTWKDPAANHAAPSPSGSVLPAKPEMGRALVPPAFQPERRPLDPDHSQHWEAFVNRERIYDFYAKQASQLLTSNPRPDLLPEFPGLDGGKYGHWGNQTDNLTWRDQRFADSDHGSVFSTVFQGAGLTIPKGICVRSGDLSGCYDPSNNAFRVWWRDGFIQLGDARHGFMGGGRMAGTLVRKEEGDGTGDPGRYHGFYRHGKEVIFSYAKEGREWLATLTTGPQDPVELKHLTKGGPPQWPLRLETRGELGRQTPFATDRLTLPFDNPYGTLFFITAHDFFTDGSALLATMTGEVWLVKGIDETLQKLGWKRFATGLHQPLGVRIVQDKIYVLGRDQITRLHDLNGDGEADFYECVTNAMTTSPGGHDFVIGLETDGEGRWYFASGNQGICRVAAPGRKEETLDILGTGFRNPNGLGISPDGHFLTTSVQEGDWTPATSLCQIEMGRNEGAHFGAGGPKNGQPPDPVLLYLPRGEDNSGSGQAFVTGGAWAGLKGEGNLVHLSSGSGSAWLVMRQNVSGHWQGAAVRLTGNFDSGPQTARFHPTDGQLYVSGMQGWGSYTPRDGCFQRVRFTGGSKPVPVGFEIRDNGILLRFSQAVENATASTCFAQCWNYRYSGNYGSPEYSLRYPDAHGHDPLEIHSLQTLDSGKTLFVEIPQIRPAHQIHLHLSTGHDLFLTAHALAQPFTDFPGYTTVAKTTYAAPATPVNASAPAPNPWAGGEPGRQIIVEAALGLQFDQRRLLARAREKLTIRFKNPDVVPHNWLLAGPGSLPALGEKCNLMITDPQGMAKHYVPDSVDVVAYTDMVPPQGEFTIHLTAPSEKGDYPYLCTFPGHWMVMNGVMVVE